MVPGGTLFSLKLILYTIRKTKNEWYWEFFLDPLFFFISTVHKIHHIPPDNFSQIPHQKVVDLLSVRDLSVHFGSFTVKFKPVSKFSRKAGLQPSPAPIHSPHDHPLGPDPYQRRTQYHLAPLLSLSSPYLGHKTQEAEGPTKLYQYGTWSSILLWPPASFYGSVNTKLSKRGGGLSQWLERGVNVWSKRREGLGKCLEGGGNKWGDKNMMRTVGEICGRWDTCTPGWGNQQDWVHVQRPK